MKCTHCERCKEELQTLYGLHYCAHCKECTVVHIPSFLKLHERLNKKFTAFSEDKNHDKDDEMLWEIFREKSDAIWKMSRSQSIGQEIHSDRQTTKAIYELLMICKTLDEKYLD